MADILVVDDDDIVCDMLARMLTSQKHSVRTAMSVSEAHTQCNADIPDVIISDIVMRNGTGIDLLGWVKQEHPNLPVIMLTGMPSAENTTEAVRLGAFGYLTKPVEDEDLFNMVNRAISYSNYLQTS